MNYRKILENFVESRGLELVNVNGSWFITDSRSGHRITLSLYREIVQTLENNGFDAWENIDLLDWVVMP